MKKLMFDKFEKFVNSSDKIIICGHENPDPDAICSVIAMEYFLTTLGKEVLCINSDETPEQLKYFDYRNVIKSLENGAKIPKNINEYSLLILDTNTGFNIGKLYDILLPKINKIFIVDHHSQKDTCVHEHIIEVSASSTSEIIYGLYEYFKIEIPKRIGDAIYAGILFDSGSFHYPKTSEYTFRIVADIVGNGTDPNKIYLALYEHESIESLKIFSFVVSTLRLFENDRIAVLKMTKSMLKRSGAEYDECSSIINYPLRSHKIKAVIYLKENLNGIKRISIRSKGNIDVAGIAISHNGGGHKNASGFKFKGTMKDFEKLLPSLIKNIKSQIK